MKENNLEAFYKYYSNDTKEQAIEDMYLDNCKLEEENEYLCFIINEAREFIQENMGYYSERLVYQVYTERYVKDLNKIMKLLDNVSCETMKGGERDVNDYSDCS